MFTAVFLISCLVMIPQTVYADLSVFTPSTADTYIINALSNNNFGTLYVLVVVSAPQDQAHSLVKFDISSIPQGATINLAYLMLYYSSNLGTNPAGRTVTANRVTKDWVELQATWNSYKTGSPWTTPGGDYVPDGAASATVPAAYGWMTWTVTDIVKAWIQGGQPNYGFLVKFADEDQVGEVQFHTREYTYEPDLRPILKVDWTPSRPVGGVVTPVNKLQMLVPYLALAGLVGAATAAFTIRKRRRD